MQNLKLCKEENKLFSVQLDIAVRLKHWAIISRFLQDFKFLWGIARYLVRVSKNEFSLAVKISRKRVFEKKNTVFVQPLNEWVSKKLSSLGSISKGQKKKKGHDGVSKGF